MEQPLSCRQAFSSFSDGQVLNAAEGSDVGLKIICANYKLKKFRCAAPRLLLRCLKYGSRRNTTHRIEVGYGVPPRASCRCTVFVGEGASGTRINGGALPFSALPLGGSTFETV
eukprot:scaffold2801_cov266-Pinguiococcus_pyrenoidosus.AAC.6